VFTGIDSYDSTRVYASCAVGATCLYEVGVVVWGKLLLAVCGILVSGQVGKL
jgi:hypothetical protein